MALQTSIEEPLSTGPHATGLDICECGDYRAQHRAEDGGCSICTPGNASPSVCHYFRLFLKATITWERA